MQSLLVLLIVGLFAQLIDGALGMSYGATSSTLLLSVGVAPAVASASVHLSEVGTCLMSGTAHWKFGNVNWRVVALIGLPGAVGAFGGAVVLSNLSTEAAEPWMAGVLLVIGLYILVRFMLGKAPAFGGERVVRGQFLAPLGLFAGFLDATGGGGWGPVSTPALLLTGKMEPRKIIGSVDTSEFIVAVAASIGFFLSLGQEAVNFGIVGALLAGGLIAAPIAAWLVRLVKPRILGAAVGGLLTVTNTRTLFATFDVAGPTRTVTYLVLIAAWALAIFIAVRDEGGVTRAGGEEPIPGQPAPSPEAA